MKVNSKKNDKRQSVLPSGCAIAGIPRYNQKWPPEKRKKGQFGPFVLQDCRLNTGITFQKPSQGLKL